MATALAQISRAPDLTAISAQRELLKRESTTAAGVRLPTLECGEVQGSLQSGVQLVNALHHIGHAEAARRLLIDLLCIAANHGVLQPFIDGGIGVHLLLHEMHDRLTIDGDVGLWIRMILRRRHALTISTAPTAVTVPATRPAGELLSMRQQAVLRLIGQGHSNKQIARYLNLAPETVKSHVKHIFAKLGTQTRAQAVSCAAQRGLL